MLSRPATRWSRLRLSRRLAGERGYTLSELLVVMIILGVVLAALAGVFVSSTKAEVDQNRRFQAQQETRMALDRLRREGHCASALSPATPTNVVTLTFGPHCRRGDTGAWTNLAAPVTSLTATSLSVGAAFGTFPAPPFHILVGGENMRVTATGAAWTVARGQLGTTATTHVVNAIVQLGSYQVTWCTSGAGSRWALRRIEGGTCPSTGGTAVADYLTQASVFCFAPASPSRRARLGVNFKVSIDGATRAYELRDDIVLRNAARAGSAVGNCPT